MALWQQQVIKDLVWTGRYEENGVREYKSISRPIYSPESWRQLSRVQRWTLKNSGFAIAAFDLDRANDSSTRKMLRETWKAHSDELKPQLPFGRAMKALRVALGKRIEEVDRLVLSPYYHKFRGWRRSSNFPFLA